MTSNHVTIAPVVEGQGDEKAVPVLLRRIAHELGVAANKEFEGWFLAAARSLAGHCGLPDDFGYDKDPEAKRDAKGIIDHAMKKGPGGHKYSETVDQARLAAQFDMKMARQSAPSFDKLWREVEALCGGSQPSS